MSKETCKSRAVNEEGYPLVAHTDVCARWIGQSESSLCPIRECWYCRYADFRRDLDNTMAFGFCHCPENQLVSPNKNREVTKKGCGYA